MSNIISGYYAKNAFRLNSFSAYFIRADKPISSCIYNNELNRLSHVIMELYTFRPPFGYMSFLAFHYANDILYTMTMRWWWYKGEAQSLSADMTKRERTKRELYTACDITCASIFSSIRKESVGWGFFCSSLSQKKSICFSRRKKRISCCILWNWIIQHPLGMIFTKRSLIEIKK